MKKEAIGELWFTEAFDAPIESFFKEKLEPFVRENLGERVLLISPSTPNDLLISLESYDFPTLRRVCEKHRIYIQKVQKATGWLSAYTGYLLSPITWRYKDTHTNKPERYRIYIEGESLGDLLVSSLKK